MSREASPFAALDPASERIQPQKPRARRWVPARAVAAARRGADLFAAACRKPTPVVLEKVLFFGGLAAVVCGCWMIYRPLGPLVGGGLAVWLGMLISVERSEPRP